VSAWKTLPCASFGPYIQLHATVSAVLVLAALTVAAAILLILELDGPFDGYVKISSGPLRFALANLGL
jgi:hypothetical protein